VISTARAGVSPRCGDWLLDRDQCRFPRGRRVAVGIPGSPLFFPLRTFSGRAPWLVGCQSRGGWRSDEVGSVWCDPSRTGGALPPGLAESLHRVLRQPVASWLSESPTRCSVGWDEGSPGHRCNVALRCTVTRHNGCPRDCATMVVRRSERLFRKAANPGAGGSGLGPRHPGCPAGPVVGSVSPAGFQAVGNLTLRIAESGDFLGRVCGQVVGQCRGRWPGGPLAPSGGTGIEPGCG
jgi:hypothetical protein